MKTVYFVRHGESDAFAQGMHQTFDTPLSELGRKQAQFVALRCAGLAADALISSDIQRAKETAEHISRSTGMKVRFSELFRERSPASVVLGRKRDDPIAKEAWRAVQDNFGVEGYRFLDEETFFDMKDRAKAAFEYLESLPEERVIVVTHGLFLMILAAYVMFGKDLDGGRCTKVIQALDTENTGITVMRHGAKKDSSWSLWIWNDHAHLADPK